MNQYKRLLQIPKSYYVDRGFPCSKTESIRIIRNTNRRKKDFTNDDEYKNYIITEYYKQQIDNIIDIYDNNKEIKIHIHQKLLQKALLYSISS